MEHTPATIEAVDDIMKASASAFQVYRKADPESKATFLETIASEMEALGDQLILTAMEETNLPAPRLMGERDRTLMQLRMFAAMVREGSWVEASIDKANPGRTPAPKPDIRKMLIPMGPVIVFGASNFPFAYSTAGGDTASALASGCTVVVKAHPSHGKVSEMVYGAIRKAIQSCNMPEGVFLHVFGGNDVGKALVQHPVTAAVGFTGSYTGGTALVQYAQSRETPIPVFSEMGSVNPVVFLPETLINNAQDLAKAYAGSITLSMGQFCTNPGLMFGIAGEALDNFVQLLQREVSLVKPAKMLNVSIHKSYFERMENALAQAGVQHQQPELVAGEMEALPNIASVSGYDFITNPKLHEEVFGPYSLMVKCKDMQELALAWKAVRGQLTTSLVGTDKDFNDHKELVDIAEQLAGRVVFNGVPTGVEVCASMVHGGPFPATTDSRFTAVGTNAVKRWVRPVCYQNCPEALLPPELQNLNQRNILRMVDNHHTYDNI